MKRLIILLSIFLLTGCSILFPSTIKLEELPDTLSKPCPDLKLVDQNTDKLSDVVTTVADNYALYHSCRSEVTGLQDWYTKQKNIINKLK